MKLYTHKGVNMPDTYNVGGKEWPVDGYYKARAVDDNGEPTSEECFIPLVNIPMMSDYQRFAKCLKSRLEHPELYEATEDVPATIEYIKQWLQAHTPSDDAERITQ